MNVVNHIEHRSAISLLDIACGPGVLTTELFWKLTQLRGVAFPSHFDISVDGLDIDSEILERAAARARQEDLEISYYRADFRHPPENLFGKYDLVFSSQGLQWTGWPPASLSQQEFIFYKHLPPALIKKVDVWANQQWCEALRNIARVLKTGGEALLQFGSEGQLNALYTLFDHILLHPRFKRYRNSIWFSLYYPRLEMLPSLFKENGLKIQHIRQWKEPLIEQTSEEIVQFVQGWSSSYLTSVMGQNDSDAFYTLLINMLNEDRDNVARQLLWHRTVVIAKKADEMRNYSQYK